MSASDPVSSSSREKEIFMAALDLEDPAAQVAYLDSACDGDADLRARVERLLGLEADSRSFLQPPSMMRKGVEALGEAVYADLADSQESAAEPDFGARGQLTAALPRQGVPPPVSASAANPDSPVPFIFGRRIAQGGMGAILEASDCKLGRTIAVKIMLSEMGCSEEHKQRFIQEAAVLGRLEHPNIVPIHDLGRDSEGFLYYTMKLVKGRTLQRILDDLRHEDKEALEHYTLDRLLTIFRKVCDALAFAHAQKIIHRDLKPENIMVGEFGEVLVMDWGIAKLLGSSNDETRMANDEMDPAHSSFDIPHSSFRAAPDFAIGATLEGAVMGTPQYMSPEQALGQVRDMDARSDIFSLGGILYAILTLRPPVEGKNVWEVIEKVSTARIAAPTTYGAATTVKGKAKAKGDVLEAKKITPLPHMPGGRVPHALSAVAMKALTLDKTKRYQDIAAFSADIEAYQGGFATSAQNAGTLIQIKLLMLRHKAVTASLAVMLVLSIGFVMKVMASERKAAHNEQIAVQERETARQALAKSQLAIAEKEFHLGKFVESQKILGETPESFRDANWRFLQAHSRDFTSQLPLLEGGLAYGLQFLPQGDRLAARCWVGPSKVAGVGIFSLMGKQIGDFMPQTEYYPITFGIDREGGRVAQAVTANEVAVWDLATRAVLRRWTCEIRAIERVLLSPDGATVLAAGERKLIAYAAATGVPLWTRPFIGVVPAFSPDGQTVANLATMKGLNLQVHLLDPNTGEVRSTLESSADHPTKTTLQFNQVGDKFACLGGDEVIMWNPRTAQKIRALHFPGETVIGMDPGGDSVATSSVSGGRIRLWATKTGRLLRSLNGIQKEVLALAFSPDGRTLVSTHRSFEDGGTYVWPTRLGEEISEIVPAFLEGRRVLFTADGSRVYAATGGDVGTWDPLTGKLKWKAQRTTNGKIRDLAIHPAGESILYSEMGGRTSFTHMSSAGKRLEDFGTSQVSSLKFNHSGRLLLTVAYAFTDTDPGNGFSVQEYPSGKELSKITFEKPGQPFAAFCLDDDVVATAALKGGITLWDWQAGKPLRQIDAAQTGSIGCLAASPDGLHLASGGPDRWIRVWEAKTGRLEVAFRAHWEGVSSLEFSPDGREILSGGDDGSVRIHDAASGEERLVFYGITTPVADVAISADGRLIAAISKEDAFTKVWDRERSSAAALPKNQPAANPPALPKDAGG